MWARFDEDGCAAWFGPEPVAGAEWIEGVDEDTLLTCRRVEGAWLPRPPVTPPEPTPEEIAAARDAEHQAALGARDAAIDAAIVANPPPGTLQGLPVITDASIPTTLGGGTEDVICVARSFDILYWEDDLLQFTFEQVPSTAPGQVRLAAGRFSLFTPGRYPTSISTIGGTGLAAPTF